MPRWDPDASELGRLSDARRCAVRLNRRAVSAATPGDGPGARGPGPGASAGAEPASVDAHGTQVSAISASTANWLSSRVAIGGLRWGGRNRPSRLCLLAAGDAVAQPSLSPVVVMTWAWWQSRSRSDTAVGWSGTKRPQCSP